MSFKMLVITLCQLLLFCTAFAMDTPPHSEADPESSDERQQVAEYLHGNRSLQKLPHDPLLSVNKISSIEDFPKELLKKIIQVTILSDTPNKLWHIGCVCKKWQAIVYDATMRRDIQEVNPLYYWKPTIQDIRHRNNNPAGSATCTGGECFDGTATLAIGGTYGGVAGLIASFTALGITCNTLSWIGVAGGCIFGCFGSGCCIWQCGAKRALKNCPVVGF